MTIYRAVRITPDVVAVKTFKDVVEADAYDMMMTSLEGVETKTFGDINGDEYVVVYYSKGGQQ